MAYIGINNVARKVKNIYIGIDGGARKVKKAYVGIDGIARLWWGDEESTEIAGIPTLPSNWHNYIAPYITSITEIKIVDSYTPTGSESQNISLNTSNQPSIKLYRNGTKVIIAGNGSGKIYTPIDSSFLFSGNKTSYSYFESCTSITGLTLLDTTKTTNMEFMFAYNCCASLDLSSFNTSNVTNMSCMFCGSGNYYSFLTSLDLSSFDTSKVTDMSCMFQYCRSLTSVDLSSFDTSKVTDMSWMFDHCTSLYTLDLSSFDFRNVSDMSWMFNQCENLQIIYANDELFDKELLELVKDDTNEGRVYHMWYNCGTYGFTYV